MLNSTISASAIQQSFRYSTTLPLFNKASATQQSFSYSTKLPRLNKCAATQQRFRYSTKLPLFNRETHLINSPRVLKKPPARRPRPAGRPPARPPAADPPAQASASTQLPLLSRASAMQQSLTRTNQFTLCNSRMVCYRSHFGSVPRVCLCRGGGADGWYPRVGDRPAQALEGVDLSHNSLTDAACDPMGERREK